MTPLQVEHPFTFDRLNGPDDFREEWDVPSLGKQFTDALSRDIDRVRTRPRPDPERKIHLFAGQAGYGKTHLFGRVRLQQADRVQFVFVPAPKGTAEIHALAVWPLVETLFVSRDGFAPVRVHLSRLLAGSFAAYFDQISPTLRAKIKDVHIDLESDPLTVLHFCEGITDLAPYHHLADSIHTKFPHVNGGVLRALVFSLSAAADDARWWLRGEAEQVHADKLAALRLPSESPPPAEVLQAVAELLAALQTPLVLCFDQLEILFDDDQKAFSELASRLMGWLQTIPNLVIAIGCLRDLWQRLQAEAGYRSFIDRVRKHELQYLSPDQAVDFVERRMKSWVDFDTIRHAGWPFDIESLRGHIEEVQPAPRGFIQQVCKVRFDDWLAKKRQGLIHFKRIDPPPPDLTFEQLWKQELEATTAAKVTATDTQEDDLWDAVEMAVAVAQIGKHLPEGMSIAKVTAQPLPPTSKDKRPSTKITLNAGGKSRDVIVAVSKNDAGTSFGHWVTAMNNALVSPVSGIVVVRPRFDIKAGTTSAAYRTYKQRLDNGTLRPFPLDEHAATFAQLECLRRITRRAAAKDLVLNGETLSVERCRELVAETGVIANLKLFEFIFENWPGLEIPSPTPPPTPPAAPAPAPPTPPREVVHPDPVVPTPAPQPRPVVPPPPPKPEPSWADRNLDKAAKFLRERGQSVHPIGAEVGPTFVRLKLELRGDADFARIRRQAENLKLHLALQHDPLIASQAGYVSIDVQRPDRQIVELPPLLEKCPAKFAGEPAFPAGVDVSGRAEWLNLSDPESCHLLVAGTTGSGKSEFLKALLAGLAARLSPEQIRFRLVDPKRVTFNIDPNCPYLNGPVVYDAAEAIPVMEECFHEMERRYEVMRQRGVDHVRHLTGRDAVPRWVVVFDEFADLMADAATRKDLEPYLRRLGAKARAAGIHLILGTQRPDASVVTPLLRANLPGRIGLQVATERESKLFLDQPDAAYLFGKGDLVWKRGGGLIRLQSPFVARAEFNRYLRVDS